MPRDREQEQIRAIVEQVEDDQAPRDASEMSDIHLEVLDDEIIVTLPGWYSVTYFKLERAPQLLAKNMSERDDPRAPMTVSVFLAKAWGAANDKAERSRLDRSHPMMLIGDEPQSYPSYRDIAGIEHPVSLSEVLGIGRPYKLFLPDTAEAFVPLTEEIPLRYEIVEGDGLSGGEMFKGSLTKLSPKGAEARLENPVPTLSNLEMHLIGTEGQEIPELCTARS
jgi:hypothetical protein